MTPGEIYNTKRENFIDKSITQFGFLVSVYRYDSPIHRIFKQANGVVTCDEFEYAGSQKTIIIHNAYHPVDYGFEINIINHLTKDSDMVYHVLKEQQDMEQSYLPKAAEFLRSLLASSSSS